MPNILNCLVSQFQTTELLVIFYFSERLFQNRCCYSSPGLLILAMSSLFWCGDNYLVFLCHLNFVKWAKQKWAKVNHLIDHIEWFLISYKDHIWFHSLHTWFLSTILVWNQRNHIWSLQYTKKSYMVLVRLPRIIHIFSSFPIISKASLNQ